MKTYNCALSSHWKLQGIPEGTYEIWLEARTGSKPPGTNFVSAYRLGIIRKDGGRFEIGFTMPSDAEVELTYRGEGYCNYYGRARAVRNVHLSNGDAISVKCMAGWAFVSKLILQSVIGDERGAIPCPRLDVAITVDGDLAEWHRARSKLTVRINRDEQVVIGGREIGASVNAMCWRGANDLSAIAWLGWNEQGLCIAIKVTDDAIKRATTSQGAWEGDCIEVFLDMRPPSAVGSPVLGHGIFQILIAPPDASGKVRVSGKIPKGIIASGRCIEHGYTVELCIPFETLDDFKVHVKRVFGFDIAIDDADNIGDERARRKVQMVWHGSANNWQDPSAYARLELTP